MGHKLPVQVGCTEQKRNEIAGLIVRPAQHNVVIVSNVLQYRLKTIVVPAVKAQHRHAALPAINDPDTFVAATGDADMDVDARCLLTDLVIAEISDAVVDRSRQAKRVDGEVGTFEESA